jgi:DNA-binding NtrC family response regulator
MKLLIVEDDQTQVELLTKVLNKVSNGELEILSVGSLKAAVQKSPEVDVVLMDLRLDDSHDPEKTLDAIPLLKKPVIIVSGVDDPDKRLTVKAYALGAQNFFQKPIGAELLGAHLLSALTAAFLRVNAPTLLQK